MTGTGSTTRSGDLSLRRYFYGTDGLRAGWRLLIFVAILEILFGFNKLLVNPLMRGLDDVTQYLARDVLDFLDFLLASWIMARIEKRTIADYGLPWRRSFRRQFWQGAVLGFSSLTVLLVLMRAMGLFYFGKVALHGAEILQFAGFFALAFLIVAVREEFRYRGYGLFTLTDGIGFWPAVLVLAVLFGYGHIGNSGEAWVGILNAVLGGLFFCFLLRRSGDLWMPIGFHLTWDWGQTYFYGVPNSGEVLPGHLFNSQFSGPAWLTGASVGPEGSLLCTLLLVVLFFSLRHWLRETKYPKVQESTSSR